MGLGAEQLGTDPTLATRLVSACEERGQLAMLRPWLLAREAEGLAEGSHDSTAVRGALRRLEPPKPKGWWG